jgi:hypothetical protein
MANDELIGFKPVPELRFSPDTQAELTAGIQQVEADWDSGHYATVFLPERSAPIVAEAWLGHRDRLGKPQPNRFSALIGRELVNQYADEHGIDTQWLGVHGYPEDIAAFKAHLVDYPPARTIREGMIQHLATLSEHPHILSVDDVSVSGATQLATETMLSLASQEAGKGEPVIQNRSFFDKRRWTPDLTALLMKQVPDELRHDMQLQGLVQDLLKGGLEDATGVVRPFTTWNDVLAASEQYGDTKYANVLASVYDKGELLGLNRKLLRSLRQTGASISP